jgi:hypothetical protein
LLRSGIVHVALRIDISTKDLKILLRQGRVTRSVALR